MPNYSRESVKGAWKPASAYDPNIHIVIGLNRHIRHPRIPITRR